MQERRGPGELGLLVASLVVLARLANGLPLWVATTLVVGAVAAAMLHLLGDWRPWRAPLDRIALPALAAFASLGIARLLDPLPWLPLAFLGTWALVAWIVDTELAQPAADPAEAPQPADGEAGPADGEPGSARSRPTTVQVATLVVAFLSFSAVGGIVPGGLAGAGSDLTGQALVAVVILDLAIGALAGGRLTAFRGLDRRRSAVEANHYGALAGHLGAFVRILGLPRLLGPALLTLAVYLWMTYRESGRQLSLPSVRSVLAMAPGPSRSTQDSL